MLGKRAANWKDENEPDKKRTRLEDAANESTEDIPLFFIDRGPLVSKKKENKHEVHNQSTSAISSETESDDTTDFKASHESVMKTSDQIAVLESRFSSSSNSQSSLQTKFDPPSLKNEGNQDVFSVSSKNQEISSPTLIDLVESSKKNEDSIDSTDNLYHCKIKENTDLKDNNTEKLQSASSITVNTVDKLDDDSSSTFVNNKRNDVPVDASDVFGAREIQSILSTEEYAISTNQLEIDSMNNDVFNPNIDSIINPKGKIFAYFQKHKLPLPEFEVSVRLNIKNQKIIELPGWKPCYKEAEKQLSYIVLRNLPSIADELYPYLPAPDESFFVEKVPDKKKDVKLKEEKIEPPKGNDKLIQFGDFLLTSLIVDKKPFTRHGTASKGDLKNLCTRMKLPCSITHVKQSNGWICSISLGGQKFLDKKFQSSTKRKEGENLACVKALDMIFGLKEFAISPFVYPIQVINSKYKYDFERSSPHDVFLPPPGTRMNAADYASTIVPVLSRLLNGLMNAVSFGKIYLGVEPNTFRVNPIPTNTISEIRSQLNGVLSSWNPSASISNYGCRIIPVYEESEIENGLHYQDMYSIHEKLSSKKSNAPVDLPSIFQYNVHANMCILILYSTKTTSEPQYITRDGLFSSNYYNASRPVPFEQLNHNQNFIHSQRPTSNSWLPVLDAGAPPFLCIPPNSRH